jgi:hypothetical protein
MTRFLAALLACLLAAPALAQSQQATPDSRREAAALVVQLNLEAQQRDMVAALRGQFIRLLAQASGKTEAVTAATVDEILVPELRARTPELTTAVAEVYASLFTAEELRGLQGFYASPLGRTLLRQQAVLGRSTLEIGAAWGQKVGNETLSRHAETLRKRGFKL